MTALYKIQGNQLVPVPLSAAINEDQLEKWISENPKIIGLDVLVIGTQIITDFGGRIDILGIDRNGDLTIIELKKNKTPRDVVAQILDYASWVSSLNTKKIHEIMFSKTGKRLEVEFNNWFEIPIPESLNTNHNLVIVASEFDPSSKRIVEYLAEKHDMSINTSFFNVFNDGQGVFLATDWLLDQQEVTERSETKNKAPWSGYWYVNIGDSEARSWEDMRNYGFISAGGGRFYSGRLEQLKVGYKVFAYQKKVGYLGFGTVTQESTLGKEFKINDNALFDLPLQQPNLIHDKEDIDKAEYVVGIRWHRTYPMNEGKVFQGAFANQNIVCKLRDPATVQFLETTFNVAEQVE